MTAAFFKALEDGYNIAVFLYYNDLITKGSGFNVFALIESRIVTPRYGMLEVISSKTVFEICEQLRIPCIATDLRKDNLSDAREVFIATIVGVKVAVTLINGRSLANDAIDPTTKKVLRT